jgi:hypothetical protein
MEQIEINVQKNIEEVEINVQPNVTQVIINEVVGAGVQSVTGNLVDNTDPTNPIINGIQSIVAGTNVSVDDTDPANPVISAIGGGGGAETFLELTDTPSTYTGQSGKYPKVNEAETGLEFDDAPAANIQQVLAVGNYDGVHGFGSREYVGSFTEDPNSDEPYRCAAFLNDSILFGDFDPLGLFKDIYISPIYDSGKLSIFNNYTGGINEGTIATEEWVQANVSGGAVNSVNNQTGDVVLDADDVGAEPALGFTPENVANKTTDINGAAGTYPDTPTVKGYVDSQVFIYWIASDARDLSFTSTTAETLLAKYFIPAGDLTNFSILNIDIRCLKTPVNSGTIRVRLNNTSDDLSTAVELIRRSAGNNVRTFGVTRALKMTDTNILSTALNINAATDYENVNNLPITETYNRANGAWIYVTGQLTDATETFTNRAIQIYATKDKI